MFLDRHSNTVYKYYSYVVAVELGVLVIDLEFARTLSNHNHNALLNACSKRELGISRNF